MEFKDYYETMGVEKSATPEDIKRAHRKLARKYHPDVSKEKNAEARFKELAEAYEVLKDPEKRAAYDRLGADYKAGQEFQPPPQWAGRAGAGGDFGGGFNGGGVGGGGDQDHSAFFESLFKGMGRGRGGQSGSPHQGTHEAFNMHGQDQHAKIDITLEDAYAGPTRTLQLRVPIEDAEGRVQVQNRTIEFVVPKGIRAGQHIRLAAQGGPGMGQGSPGDLYLDVSVLPHPLYRADGRDVYMDLPVTPWEAALGAEVEAPTPTGRVEVKVPAGSQAGRKLRLKGRGLPGNLPGDFYFVLHITLPPAEGDTAKKAYTDLHNAFSSFSPRAEIDRVHNTLEAQA